MFVTIIPKKTQAGLVNLIVFNYNTHNKFYSYHLTHFKSFLIGNFHFVYLFSLLQQFFSLI